MRKVKGYDDTWLVLEFSSGTLANRLQRSPKLDRPDLLKIVTVLAGALDHFHSVRIAQFRPAQCCCSVAAGSLTGVTDYHIVSSARKNRLVHMDIKPENIFQVYG